MKTWQERALEATGGIKSQFGAIIVSALDKNVEGENPQFIGKATVTSDGFLMCGFIDQHGGQHMGAFVGSLDDLWHNADGLAKHLKFNALEEAAFRKSLKDWIGQDYRS